MSDDQLHYYHCRPCQVVAIARVKGRWKCTSCRWWMRLAYSVPVTTDEQRDLYARGITYKTPEATKPRRRFALPDPPPRPVLSAEDAERAKAEREARIREYENSQMEGAK